jgi:hypothetical protein
MGPTSLTWESLIEVGGGFGHWLPSVLTHKENRFRFRLAPEPPEKNYRPWEFIEVPVGALTRPKADGGNVLMIIGRFSSGALIAGGGAVCPLHDLLKLREHSLDNGKTWLPCGVEVTA